MSACETVFPPKGEPNPVIPVHAVGTRPVSKYRRDITSLYTFSPCQLWHLTVELAEIAAAEWTHRSGKPDHDGVKEAADRLKFALGFRGVLSDIVHRSAWPHYHERFANHLPPAPLLHVRDGIAQALVCLAGSAIDLSGAAKNRVAVPSPLVERGTLALVGGLRGLICCTAGTRPKWMTPSEVARGESAAAKLEAMLASWGGIDWPDGWRRSFDGGGYYAVPPRP